MLDKIYWDDSFIREAYIISPSYVMPKVTIAPNALPDVFVLIATPADALYGGIELIFQGVQTFACSFTSELSPYGKVNQWNTTIQFGFIQQPSFEMFDIYAERLFFRLLEKSETGYKQFYGSDNPFDSTGYRE